MKKLFVVIVCVVSCFVGRASTDGYRITGKAPGVKKAMAYLVINSNNVTDTIARAEIINERFELNGNVSEVIPTLLVLSNQSMGGVPLYLENKEYQVEIDPNYIYYSTIKGGGETQRISDEYRDIEVKNRKEIDKYREELEKLKPEDVRYQELLKLFQTVNDRVEADQKVFCEKYANSYLTLEFLASRAQKCSLEELKEGLSKFSPELQKSFSGRNIATWIAEQENVGAGHPAPDFTVQDPEGKSFNFYSVKAKVRLIDFWASWCSPCRAMVPNLKKLYEEYHDKGLEIVSISMDVREDYWLRALKEEAMPWVHGCDFKGCATMDVPLMKAYAFWGVPYLVLVDENNRVITRAAGANELPKIRKVISDILGK